jgi:hypothetical protein
MSMTALILIDLDDKCKLGRIWGKSEHLINHDGSGGPLLLHCIFALPLFWPISVVKLALHSVTHQPSQDCTLLSFYTGHGLEFLALF